jgi:hypothetical protein
MDWAEGKRRGDGKKMFLDETNSAIYCQQRAYLSQGSRTNWFLSANALKTNPKSGPKNRLRSNTLLSPPPQER